MMKNTIDAKYKFRLSTEIINLLAKTLQLQPQTLYRTLNGNIPLSPNTSVKLSTLIPYPAETIRGSKLDNLNKTLYLEWYIPLKNEEEQPNQITADDLL